MPILTAPHIEVTQVVTGFMYELTIAEEENGTGITRIEIGPYSFGGVTPRVRYPEAVTHEMAPPDWQAIRWVTDEQGRSWLRLEGGIICSGDDEALFQFTSNYQAAAGSGPKLIAWRGNRSESYTVPVPDYSIPAPNRNSRHDSQGLGQVYKQSGCMPQVVLGCLAIGGLVALAAIR
jgi:hypothetical protein